MTGRLPLFPAATTRRSGELGLEKIEEPRTFLNMAAKTVLEVLNATTAFFKKRGVESAQLNAQLLMAHVLGMKNKMDVYMEFERALEERELAPLRNLVKRRAGGEPLQHLLGSVEFHGRSFRCDKRALIPRPETEQLCELILAAAEKPARVLDAGTGSGVIALTLAAEWPEAKVDAADVSADALALAAENAAALGLGGRVTFFQSDLFERLPAEARYGLIAANLPYIAAVEIPGLSREVQCDPIAALDGGGSDGAEILRRFAAEAGGFLEPGGRVALEIGAGQGDGLAAHFAALGYGQIEVRADYQGVPRFLFATFTHHG